MDPFQIPFQIAEEDGIPNSERYCTIQHTQTQKVLASPITAKSQPLHPLAVAIGLFHGPSVPKYLSLSNARLNSWFSQMKNVENAVKE